MNRKKKTIDDLYKRIEKGFKDTRKHVDKSIEELARMTAKGFEAVDKRFGGVDNKLGMLSEQNRREHEDIELRLTRACP